MTLRTKSRGMQWMAWGGLALVALVVAAVWSFLATGSVSVGYFCPSGNRLALPFFALFVYLAWEMRWDGIRRGMRDEGSGAREGEKVEVEGQGQRRNLTSCAAEPLVGARGAHALPVVGSGGRAGSPLPAAGEQNENENRHSPTSTLDFNSSCTASSPPPHLPTSPNQPTLESATGKELFDQARAMPHQMIPDFDMDGQYLDLLGRSAKKGYAPALAKLGEYAMRRAAWVEAYYWMKQAQRSGMHGLSPTLREIRKHWAQDGFPRQSSNVNELFPAEAGSLGRALLRVDSGHEAAKAKEFLRVNHPEFLP